MKFLHIWSINIILLLFIFAAIGFIFNEKRSKKVLTAKLLKYYHIILSITILTGLLMIVDNLFWIQFPLFQYKIFIIGLLVTLSVLHKRFISSQSNIRSILTILLVIIIYSISMIIGSYAHA
tara:strand:- start:1183 stop:1548 length:366 start_codon:yes stop_codon:yes gene_type:complete